MDHHFQIKPAIRQDVPLLLSFIKELAEYEKLSHEVSATVEILEKSLFDKEASAHALIGYLGQVPVSMAVYFYNFSTFLGRSGLYLEDLYVKPEVRGQGIGQKMLAYLAHIAKTKNLARFEWSVLDWNETAIRFYKKLGAKPMDGWTVFRATGQTMDNLAATWQPAS